VQSRREPPMRPGRKPQRGYTVVELLMALAIFSVGVTGIFSMQAVTSATNRFAKNLSVATTLARSWQDRLAMDGTLWGGSGNWPITNTTWLQLAAQDQAWRLPTNDSGGTGGTFGPGADARGQFVDYTVAVNDVVFCTHIRLTRLISEVERPGSGLIRSEVRVFWPKDGDAWNNGANYCDAAADVADIGARTSEFHFVYQSSAIRQMPNF
jgi:prepilin-type N-terminal cleavage/methylation domain-containing protein